MTPDEIEKDRSEGTSGPWRVGPVDDTVVIAPDGSEVAAIDGDYNEPDLWPVMEANARRIARLPDLEQAYLDLTAENAALKERVAELESDMTKILQDTGDAIANALEQMTKGNWRDDMGHAVHMNTHMMHLRDTLAAMVNYREAHPFTLPNRATLEKRND